MSNRPQTWTTGKSGMRAHGCLVSWITWISWFGIAVILIFLFIRDNPQWRNPVGLIVSVFNPSPLRPIVFIAKTDIAMFTVITKDKIDIQQTDQANGNDQVERQMQTLLDRITLRRYEKGEAINSSDLGPRVSLSVNYQVREIIATSSIVWMHVGDTVEFNLIVTFCSSTKNSNSYTVASSTCTPPAISKTESHLLTNVVLLQLGQLGKDGTIPLLAAIPIHENRNVLPLLDRAMASITAYPVGNTIRFTVVPTL